MDHFREIKNCLSWHNEGKFEVELINGVIKKLHFCEPGKGPEDAGKSLTSTNYRYLQSVYNCLGELFDFIDDENKRLGYSFSDEGLNPVRHRVEIMEINYPVTPPETRMRPLINYSHQTELIGTQEEAIDLIRDIG